MSDLKNKIEIHIITYNEEVMLPFTIDHYKRMFTDPILIVHDNYSTDRTVQIALENGCKVIPFESEGGMNDTIHAQIKSNAILNAAADWVLCIDCDEECMINTEDLLHLEELGVNAVQFEGWNIFDQVNSPFEVNPIKGIQDGGYSKPVLYRSGCFSKVQLAVGAHTVHEVIPFPGKEVIWSKFEYKLLHFKHWSIDWNLKRSAELAARQSQENRTHSYSYHFSLPENVHRDFFNTHFNNRVEIIDRHIKTV